MKKRMLKKPRRLRELGDFSDMWEWLRNHPMFDIRTTVKVRGKKIRTTRWMFPESLDILYVKVSPKSNQIVRDPSKNTKIRVWLELHPPFYNRWLGKWDTWHNIKLDSGGDTFEDAIRDLIPKVLKHYGDWEEVPYTKAQLARFRQLDQRMKEVGGKPK